jgi:hypothetical protein
MATTDKLPPDSLKSIAAQLPSFIGRRPIAGMNAAAAVAEPDEVGESFAICVLDVAQVKKPPQDLSKLANPSGYWHHQLRVGGAATHTAVSMKVGFGDGHEVQQMFATPVAGKIDAAIRWVDANVTGKATVRLLVAPAYLLHALLIIATDGSLSAVLADQPAGLTQLQLEKRYPFGEFLKLLAKEKPAGTII